MSGYVYYDANNDGSRTGESAITGTTLTLTGTDDRGQSVNQTTSTDANGFYQFSNLAPGRTSDETQPAGYFDGKDTIGTQGGTPRRTLECRPHRGNERPRVQFRARLLE